MSINYPYRDIASDALRRFPAKPYMIITDQYLPVKIFSNGNSKPCEFHIFTTSIDTCMDRFGSRVWPYQNPDGYMCHGETDIPVKVPYLNQPMWFRTVATQVSNFSRHHVLRIYNKSICEVLGDPFNWLRLTLDELREKGNPVNFTDMLITTLHKNSYDSFFLHLLTRATGIIKGEGLAFPPDETDGIYQLLIKYHVEEQAIFESGFIFEEEGSIHISDALLYLYMEAIQHQKFLATQLDQHGILRLT